MKNRSLYVLALGIFGLATTEFGVVGILPQLAKAFNVSIDKAGWLISAFALIVACFGPFIVLLTSRINRKKMMCIALLVFCIANVFSALATSFTWMLIARMLPAFFHPVFWSIALTTAAGLVDQKDAPKAVSIVFGGFTIACVLGTPLLSFITNTYNWQAAFYLSAIINALSLFGLYYSLPASVHTEVRTTVNYASVLKAPALWFNIVISFFIISAMYCSYSYIADYVEKVLNVHGNMISIMLILFGVAGVMGNILAGKYMSKNSRATLLVFILALIAVHLFLYFSNTALYVVVGLIALWGLIHTAGFVISNINVTASSPAAPEFLNSIFTSVGNFAVTMGATAGGFWIKHFGVHNIVWGSIFFLCLAIAAVIIKTRIRPVINT